MALTLILALQAVAPAPAAPAPVAPAAGGPGWAMADPGALRGLIDPAGTGLVPGPDGNCRNAPASDVLVCGRRPRGGGDYPLAQWSRIFGPEAPLRAETNLGGGVTGRAYAEDVAMDRGAISHRVMVGIKLPF